MATIRQKGPGQWHAQVRHMGWPVITETKRTRTDAEAWARDVESQMDRGVFVDRSAAERTPFVEIINISIKEVTEKRPGEASRASEKSRLERFMRDDAKFRPEPALVSAQPRRRQIAPTVLGNDERRSPEDLARTKGQRRRAAAALLRGPLHHRPLEAPPTEMARGEKSGASISDRKT